MSTNNKRNQFQKNLIIGKSWEKQFGRWLTRNFDTAQYEIKDTSDQHRDHNNNQVPDFCVRNLTTNKVFWFDAKRRKVYRDNGNVYFGFDRRYLISYRAYAQLANSRAFVAFYDTQFDALNFYMLNVMQEPDLMLTFDNSHGSEPAFRWNIKILKKISLA
jgi:hypothetical protein